jgi:hypothetical protein
LRDLYRTSRVGWSESQIYIFSSLEVNFLQISYSRLQYSKASVKSWNIWEFEASYGFLTQNARSGSQRQAVVFAFEPKTFSFITKLKLQASKSNTKQTKIIFFARFLFTWQNKKLNSIQP